MSAPKYRGVSPPQAKEPAVYNVIGPEFGTGLDLTILDEQILGMRAHWVVDPQTKRGRSRICHDWEGTCPYCTSGVKKIWLGWLAVWNHAARRRDILRLGPQGAEAIAARSAPLGGLRGLRLNLTMVPSGRGNSLAVAEAREAALIPLLAAHSLAATLCLVLGVDRVPDERYTAAELTEPTDSDERGGV